MKLRRRELWFELGGLASPKDGSQEFVSWAKKNLKVGDRLTVQIVDADRVDPPVGINRVSKAQAEESRRRSEKIRRTMERDEDSPKRSPRVRSADPEKQRGTE